MSHVIYTDRSRIETAQHCKRERFLRYHEGGLGLEPASKPLPLAVGGSVHVGLASLLNGHNEGAAVGAALTDFAQFRSALAVDTAEAAALAATPIDSLEAQMAATARDLGMSPDDPSLVALHQQRQSSAQEWEQWLYREQSALVEGLVRAYARRRLRSLLEEYEVLEVEREGEWELAEGHLGREQVGVINLPADPYRIVFMSRPDALLRSRADGNLYLLSYKTAATWDIRKARDAEHDMQGLSEAIDVERRLGERVMGIRYEYLLKGARYEDKDLSRRFGLNVWSQRSPLLRRYVCHSTPSRGKNVAAFSAGDACWSWDFLTDTSEASKLSASNWHAESIFDERSGGLTVAQWVAALDDSEEAMSAWDSTTGMEPRALGWRSRAQALGYTTKHPLDELFPAPLTVYRSDDQARDWLEQVEAEERRVAEGVARVEAATDEGERRSVLNVEFPMSRRACSYPVECPFTKVCYGGDDIRRDPLGSGLYKRREPHHTPEAEALLQRERA